MNNSIGLHIIWCHHCHEPVGYGASCLGDPTNFGPEFYYDSHTIYTQQSIHFNTETQPFGAVEAYPCPNCKIGHLIHWDPRLGQPVYDLLWQTTATQEEQTAFWNWLETAFENASYSYWCTIPKSSYEHLLQVAQVEAPVESKKSLQHHELVPGIQWLRKHRLGLELEYSARMPFVSLNASDIQYLTQLVSSGTCCRGAA